MSTPVENCPQPIGAKGNTFDDLDRIACPENTVLAMIPGGSYLRYYLESTDKTVQIQVLSDVKFPVPVGLIVWDDKLRYYVITGGKPDIAIPKYKCTTYEDSDVEEGEYNEFTYSAGGFSINLPAGLDFVPKNTGLPVTLARNTMIKLTHHQSMWISRRDLREINLKTKTYSEDASTDPETIHVTLNIGW